MKFVTTLERDEDGVWIAECPSIPGCVSQGKTCEEALTNLREAIAPCLEVRAQRGLPLTVEGSKPLPASNPNLRSSFLGTFTGQAAGRKTCGTIRGGIVVYPTVLSVRSGTRRRRDRNGNINHDIDYVLG